MRSRALHPVDSQILRKFGRAHCWERFQLFCVRGGLMLGFNTGESGSLLFKNIVQNIVSDEKLHI